MKIGLEIECVVNLENFAKPKGGYHHGNPISDHWVAESDGSLEDEGIFDNEDTYEFVSTVFSSKQELMDGLKEFKAQFGNKPLAECLDFNSSCGAHVHFSYDKPIGRIIPVSYWEQLRASFFNKLSKADINDLAKREIIRRYFRSFAEKVSDSNALVRHREINITSEIEKGMEWRSPNLTGISSWDEMFLFYDIVWDCLEDLSKVLTGKVTFPKKEIRVEICAI